MCPLHLTEKGLLLIEELYNILSSSRRPRLCAGSPIEDVPERGASYLCCRETQSVEREPSDHKHKHVANTT